MATSGQSIQFSCSRCSTMLKEATSLPDSMHEECPVCGSPLSEAWKMRIKKQQSRISVRFQTAYEANACLGLGIKEIDSFLDLRLGDRLCIIGEHANLLATRLCVRAFLPIRQGGLGAESIVFVDAGNSSDMYQCASFARQSGLEIHKVLGGIAVSRAFTIHQLAQLIVYELPKALREFKSKIVVVSDLLQMFLEDPQVNKKEARYLVGEMIESLHKMEDIMLITSVDSHALHDDQILPLFAKRIEVTRAKQLGIILHNGRKSQSLVVPEKELYISR